MGSRLVPSDATNPYGHWEDYEFVKLNSAFLTGRITHSKWESNIRKLIECRVALGIPWGWKDPRTCDLLRDYLEFFDDPPFIRCIRSATQIEASIIKAYGWTPTNARLGRLRREQELDRYLPRRNTLEVNFTELRTDRRSIVESLVQFCGLGGATEQHIVSAINFIRPLREP